MLAAPRRRAKWGAVGSPMHWPGSRVPDTPGQAERKGSPPIALGNGAGLPTARLRRTGARKRVGTSQRSDGSKAVQSSVTPAPNPESLPKEPSRKSQLNCCEFSGPSRVLTGSWP
ncbi:hypothetical protein SKAU_G00317110 [Synaphobranchus kaupii]|uniref:Uncharacterized protein n=1 Tax=Synaphobranchus kaupii TaxID=118154 RepID=A0A9Q1ILU9_SYNKA|nr:hypothetical protein SKAU_G00317110 [Synaphobranchus kaupii]